MRLSFAALAVLAVTASSQGNAQDAPQAAAGARLLYKGGLPIPVPGYPGSFYARALDGSISRVPLQTGEGRLLYLGGLPIPVPGVSGGFYVQMSDGSVGMRKELP